MQSYKVLEAKIVCKHFLDFLTEERNFFVRVTTEIMNRRKTAKNRFSTGSQKFTMIDTEKIIMEILTIIACWRIKENNWGRRKFHFCLVEFN